MKAAGQQKSKRNKMLGLGIAGVTYLANRNDLKAPLETAQRTAQNQLLSAAGLYENLGDRPEMNAQVDRLKSIYDLAQQGMPDEVRSNAEMNIAQSQAQALRDLGERGGGVRGAGMVQGQANQAYRDLNAQDAQMQMDNTMKVGSQLAQAEAMQEAYNKLTPYEQMFNQISGLMGSSQQNQMLASNLQSNLAAQNIAMGADVGGAIYAQGDSQSKNMNEKDISSLLGLINN